MLDPLFANILNSVFGQKERPGDEAGQTKEKEVLMDNIHGDSHAVKP